MDTTLVLIAAAAGAADAAGSSWRHLHRPIRPGRLAYGMVRQAAGSFTGILLWLTAVIATCAALTDTIPRGLQQAATPLLAVVLTRIPVLGRPLLVALHLLSGVLIATTAATVLPGWAAWTVTLLGYLAFLYCREKAAPRRGTAPPLHQLTAPTVTRGGNNAA